MADPASAPRAGRGLAALERIAALASAAGLALAGLACFATFALVCYAVAMRYFANRPQAWSDEVVGWLILATVMLALPEAQRRGEHIGVDLLLERASARGRRALYALGLLTVLVCGVLFVAEGMETIAFTRMVGLVSNVVPEVPLWAVQALVPVGGALLILVAAVQLVQLLLLGAIPERSGERSVTAPE